MAEFKLGRIRFVWKGAWATATTYVKDDIVRFGGRTYVCIVGHTSASDFYTDVDNIPTRWNKVSDGTEWKGDWNPLTLYKEQDIVRYGGRLYICNNGHTSAPDNALGLEDNQSDWDLYATGFDWKGAWSTDFRYKVNDVVKYGGQSYVCNEGHTSAATATLGLEDDQSKWDIYAESFDWQSDWTTNTRYKVNDVVKYGGQTYICNQGHTSAATATLGLENDQSKWDYFNKGLEYKGLWSGSSVRYKINDIVKYGADTWICTTYHTSSATFAESNWARFVEGLQFEDSWLPSSIYQPGDVVTYGGYSYIAATNNTNKTPTVYTSDWTLYTTGFKFMGDWGSPNYYEVGNVVRYGGYTYVALADHEATDGVNDPPNITYWSRLNSGIRWRSTWGSGTGYRLGDAVQYGPNSYICVSEHTSGLSSRPDNDTTGLYWNQVAQGSATAVLTTTGDIVYYGGAGATRLPIGADGQVLRVTGNAPSWAYFGVIDQVYYVAPTGTDTPAPVYGVTLDKPWKTVRYAAEQVENGPLNPNARNLLERNRTYIQAETIAWINYQITNNIAPFVSAFTYDTTKCERDIGLIIDALAYDLSHGGNVKSRESALAYVTSPGNFYVLGQKEETVAAINYALTVIDAVISNLAPASSYQGSVTRVADATKTEETTAQTIINGLTTIITDAITAGVSTNIPSEVRVNFTIFVKTGIYYEVLPIIVPRETAIVGDELRSTNIRPAPSLVASGDVTYSLAALTRLSSIISNVLQNSTSGTKSTGNAETQVTTRPASTGAVGTVASNLFTAAKNYIDYYVNSVGSAPTLTGTNTAITTQAYYNAVGILEENKEFLAAEAVAYINLTYPAYSGTYDEDACKRDVRAYVDAIKYDLIYTGNYKTLLAAGYYANAVNSSVTKNMFLVRNGTGIRNMTVQGLTGTLGAANVYGTKRPSAGAYVSLDSGWGPNDSRVWVSNKSCYVQNVTTFGTGCVGLKIDGTLHNGGNRSIVANDFTQVLSDGIGVWCTGSNALTELVSVFSYYAHIGYLAENGGKIRATNGNSSYGAHGTVSEGVDSSETAITAVVDNQATEAQVGSVFTSGSVVYRLEYTNAGQEYDTAAITVNGSGINAAVLANEFRDDGVFEVRLTDPANTGSTGGTGYITATNVAQGGNSTQITLAATDSALSSAYVGMKITIISGTGVGQYGYINTYNNGTKIATVYKDSTGTSGWDHVVPGTPIASSLDLTTSYLIEPRLTFTSPTYTNNTSSITSGVFAQDAIAYGDFVKTYTAIAATGGSGASATFNVQLKGHRYYLTQNAAGTGYVVGNTLTIAGASLGGSSPTNSITVTVTGVNATTGAITNYTFTGTGRGGLYVAVAANGNVYSSYDGITWGYSGNTGLAGNTTGLAYGVIGGTSYWVAVNSTTTSSWTEEPGSTGNWAVTNGTITVPGGSGIHRIAFGSDRFVTFNTSTGDAAYATTMLSWTASSNTSAAGNAIAYGAGKFVIPNSGSTSSKYSTNGVTWVSMTTLGASAGITYGNNKFVATYLNTQHQYSFDGITWYASGTVVSNTWTTIRYGQGLFFAIAAGNANAASSEDGVNWTTRALSSGLQWTQLAFGNANGVPRWVVVPQSNTTINYFTNFVTTQARAKVVDGAISEIRIIEPGSGYSSVPTMTIVDPNNTVEATWTVRKADGVLANPTFTNRGTQYATATATVTSGTGYADIYQTGSYVNVRNLSSLPTAGSNIQFAGDSTYYKLVNITNFLGTGPYTARFQISPVMSVYKAPADGVATTLRIKYSQVRLTGHDFLSIGTGNFANTNYPGTPLIAADPTKETVEGGGGRVFYTSTDQDGNFRVGTLFSVEQATGVATLNADAFNIAGLNELTLGAVALGGTGATITEFSTDPYFTANSDNIVPTQRAIKAYVTSQIGGGGSSLNVNTLTAGVIYVAGNTITTTSGVQINVPNKMNFTGGIDGSPVAMNFFLLS